MMPTLFDNVAEPSDDGSNEFLLPWLRVYDQGLLWLTYFWLSLRHRLSHGTISHDEQSPVRFTGAILHFGVGVRRLILAGQDYPARVLLRTMSEVTFTATVLFNDRDMRHEIQGADTFEDEYKFWRNHLSGRHMDRRLREIEERIGIEGWATEEFSRFRKGLAGELSAVVHPTYGTAALAVYHESPTRKDYLHETPFGAINANSRYTLDRGAKVWLYFGYFGYRRALDSGGAPYLPLDIERYDNRAMVVAHDVFEELVRRHWDDADRYGEPSA
ncbi:MAG TPA: hypothetical protein VHT23_03560 [Gemmatimonadaceae bacterium]|nr:hypothetical protein [Gemmatimonadaceae bacterium]